MSVELKPCPFCGSEPRVIERPDNIGSTRFFYAIACFCGGYSVTAHKAVARDAPDQAKHDAVAAWNTRPTTDAELETVAWLVNYRNQEPQIVTDPNAVQFYIDRPDRYTVLRLCDQDQASAVIADLKAINANLMGDDEDKPRYTTKRLKQEVEKAVAHWKPNP